MTILPDDEYNQTLIQNVHPSGWVNPEPSGPYNLVVMGAGPRPSRVEVHITFAPSGLKFAW